MQLKNKPLKKVNAANLSVGVVVSRFNESITTELLGTALQALKKSKVKTNRIEVMFVPGAMEIPFALQKMARRKKYNCLVALGCVIRGDTPHFDYVCKTAQEGVLRVSLDHVVPIGFGVVTVNTAKQAKARIHIGFDAVMAALELATL
ncbi:MAG: 6,7-dimethyl-8-ribityllumazine synthase [Parcubacteria group bacterium Greene0714_7]|nr:MAG: 6,7-dimethyl-8-ribityllumazine synthase [Parcubacteria group bacterium Greene0714_7]